MTVELRGSNLIVRDDNNELLWNTTDTTGLTKGTFGLYAWGNSGAYFDDIEILSV
jgi:hypothetical protein